MNVADAVTVGVIALLGAATGVIAKAKWSEDRFRRFIPGAVVTVLGLLVLVVFYRWGFDQADCESRADVVCVTNANQGILTLLALLLAGVAIWVEVIARVAQDQRAAAARANEAAKQAWDDEGRANRAVAAAIEEMHHNMLHVGLAYDGDRVTGAPWDLWVSAVEALRHPDLRHLVDDGVVYWIDPLCRTVRRLEELSIAVRDAGSEEARTAALATLAAEPESLTSFIQTAFGFFGSAWAAYSGVPACRQTMEKSGLEQLQALIEASQRDGFYRFYRTSEPSATKVAKVRADDAPVACWFDDRPLGVKTFEFGPSFVEAASEHSHGAS